MRPDARVTYEGFGRRLLAGPTPKHPTQAQHQKARYHCEQ